MLPSKLSSFAEVFLPCPFDLVVVLADKSGRIAEFVRGEADAFSYRDRVMPELGASTMATSMYSNGFAQIAFVCEKEEFAAFPAKCSRYFSLPLAIDLFLNSSASTLHSPFSEGCVGA